MAQTPVQNPSAVCSSEHLVETVAIYRYTFKSFQRKDTNEGDSCLQVVYGGRVIFQRTIDSWAPYILGQRADAEHDIRVIPNGTDVTGRGHPDMIVSMYTGGAHCCTMHYVFELEPNLQLLATLDAADSDLAHFADLDNNGHFFYLAEDWTFAYWPSSFAGSPFAPVVLEFVDNGKGGGGYHLAFDKMHKPAPDAAQWMKNLHEGRSVFSKDHWVMDGTIWNTELQLIYSGHADLTMKFLDEVWPLTTPGRVKWAGDFCAILRTSPYWHDLKDTLNQPSSMCKTAMHKEDHR